MVAIISSSKSSKKSMTKPSSLPHFPMESTTFMMDHSYSRVTQGQEMTNGHPCSPSVDGLSGYNMAPVTTQELHDDKNCDISAQPNAIGDLDLDLADIEMMETCDEAANNAFDDFLDSILSTPSSPTSTNVELTPTERAQQRLRMPSLSPNPVASVFASGTNNSICSAVPTRTCSCVEPNSPYFPSCVYSTCERRAETVCSTLDLHHSNYRHHNDHTSERGRNVVLRPGDYLPPLFVDTTSVSGCDDIAARSYHSSELNMGVLDELESSASLSHNGLYHYHHSETSTMTTSPDTLKANVKNDAHPMSPLHTPSPTHDDTTSHEQFNFEDISELENYLNDITSPTTTTHHQQHLRDPMSPLPSPNHLEFSPLNSPFIPKEAESPMGLKLSFLREDVSRERCFNTDSPRSTSPHHTDLEDEISSWLNDSTLDCSKYNLPPSPPCSPAGQFESLPVQSSLNDKVNAEDLQDKREMLDLFSDDNAMLTLTDLVYL